ncbi:MAG: T9SS type A sorting domain-containing protein, partial [Candidatus Heimdallarchaeota archaeon]
VYNDSDVSDIQLISNTPNPWAEYTNINFYLPKSMDVEFAIYDLAGRKLITKNGNYNEGLNTIIIEQSELNADGVLYYEIKTSTRKIVKKMIALKK